MIWQISIAVIALAFLALVIFLILTLVSLRKSLQLTNETLEDLHLQVNDLTEETTKILKSSNDIVTNIYDKMKAFDPLFQSIHNVSDTIEDATDTFKKITTSATHHFADSDEDDTEHAAPRRSSKKDKIINVVEWALMGVTVWQKLLSRR